MWLDCPRRFASIQFVERYKKYDLLLWRLVTAVDGVLGKPFMDWALLHHLLFNLAHYLRSCQTARRALCFHAAHLCIEQLEQLLCMCQQRDCVDVDAAKTVYYLLDIFDSMMYSEKPAEVMHSLGGWGGVLGPFRQSFEPPQRPAPPPPPARHRTQGGGRPMGTTAYGGKRSKGRAANGDRPIGAASCRREQHTMATCQTPPPATHTQGTSSSTPWWRCGKVCKKCWWSLKMIHDPTQME